LSLNPINKVAFAALPAEENIIAHQIIQKDARVDVLSEFFKYYKSPLEPFAQDVVRASDSYSIDYRLIPAIAMQESNLCSKIIKDSYNCWGFGIYGKKVTRFINYKEGIDVVTRTLATEYKNKGLETPDQIMKKYTPSNNGSWANGVNHFMSLLTLTP